jgi:ribosomal protein L11 methyltransferase
VAWRQFVMHLGELPAAEVEALFEHHGALAVTLADAGDAPVVEPAPGETPLWQDTQVTGLFPEGHDLAELRRDLCRTFQLVDLPPHRVEHLPDRVWEREWLHHFRPMRFGSRLWVSPREFPVDAGDAVVMRLDPGLAFGTGTHPTTALALEWLDSLELTGCRVLDFGCGSGILAIAACLLGARAVTACDIDPQALTATRQNAECNGVAGQVAVAQDAGTPAGDFDIVVANIVSGTLIRCAPEITAHLRPGGRLLLSGILESQAGDVVDAYRDRVTFAPPSARDGWIRLTGRRA